MPTALEVTPRARHVSTDVLHWLTDCVWKSDDAKLDHWNTLEYFWSKLDPPTYGPMVVRYRLAKVIAAVCHSSDPHSAKVYQAAHEQEQSMAAAKAATKGPRSSNKAKKTLLSPAFPLAAWREHHWTDLEGVLAETRDVMLRVDSVGSNEENKVEDAARVNQGIYTTKFDKIVRYIELHRALATFRWELEQQVAMAADPNNDNKHVSMDAAKLAEHFDELSDDDLDAKTRKALETLLVRGQASTRSTRSHGVAFVPPAALRLTLSSRPFDLRFFQNKIQQLMACWMRDTIGEALMKQEPTLTVLGYTGDEAFQMRVADDEPPSPNSIAESHEVEEVSEPESVENDENESPVVGTKRKLVLEETRSGNTRKLRSSPASSANPSVARLRDATRNLRNEGTDPLAEATVIASKAAAASPNASKRDKGGLYEQKKSAKAIAFSDSDDDENVEAGVTLSEVPQRAHVKTPRGPKVAPDARGKGTGGKRKRVFFTSEETTALKQALEKYGPGHWGEMKSDLEYSIIFRNRTAVNLKDKYRNMRKNNEI